MYDLTNYCVYMNNSPFINNKGNLHLCCKNNHNQIDGNIKTHKLSDMYYSLQYKALRDKMYIGKKINGCHICYDQENIKQTSFRQRALSMIGDKPLQDSNIRMLDLRVGSLCNLMCSMCHPSDSSKWHANYSSYATLLGKSQKSIHVTLDTNSPDLLNWAEYDQSWENIFCSIDKNYLKQVYIAGGEPFYIKNFHLYMNELKKRAPLANITINTNATRLLLNKHLDIFKDIILRISIDGFGEYDEYQRLGTSWAEKLEVIDQYYNNFKVLFFDITITALTIRSVPMLVNFLHNKFPSVRILFRPVVNRPEQDLRILPQHLLVDVINFVNNNIDNPKFYNIKQLQTFLKDSMLENKHNLRKFVSHWDTLSELKLANIDNELYRWVYADNSS